MDNKGFNTDTQYQALTTSHSKYLRYEAFIGTRRTEYEGPGPRILDEVLLVLAMGCQYWHPKFMVSTLR